MSSLKQNKEFAMRIPSLRAFALTLLASTSLATASQSETLANALVGAYTHSGLLDQNRALLKSADEDVAQAAASLRPTINFVSSYGYNSANASGRDATLSYGFELSWLLYDGGARNLRREALKEVVLLTRQNLLSVEQDVLLSAVRAYMDVVKQSETVVLRQGNVRLITQELRAAEDRFEVGEVTRTDVALAEARLAQARANLAAAQGSLATAVAQYENDIGRKPGAVSTPSRTPGVPGSLNAAQAKAREMNPSIKSSQHAVASAELLMKVAEKGLSPTVSASAGYSQTDESTESDRLSLNLTVPLYSGGAELSSIRQARAVVEQRRAELHLARHRVDLNVATAYAQLDIARATLEAGERQVRASTIAFRGTREEAALGSRTTLDVLDAEQELLDAQVNVITAAADEVAAVYGVLASMGMLTAKELGLPVKTYDPSAYYNLVKDAPAASISEQGKALERVLRGMGKN